jgi:hypothetical protein
MPAMYYGPGSGYRHAGPADGRLSGTGCLADDLWLLAHHERSGRPHLHKRPLGLGLAAGLLAELMIAVPPGIVLWSDDAVTVCPEIPKQAVRAHPVLGLIAAETQPLPVQDWLMFLSRTAAGQIGARLEEAGYVTRCGSRIPGWPTRLAPVNRDWAYMPVTRIGAALGSHPPPGVYGALLAGLAVACGLGYRLDLYITGAGPAAEAAVARLPQNLQLLIARTQTAVSAAVLTRT